MNSGAEIKGNLDAENINASGEIKISGDISGDKINVGSDGTIIAQNLKFNDSAAVVSGENDSINFNNKAVMNSGAEIKGSLDAENINASGEIKLTGDQNMNFGGNYLVNCRTTLDMVQGGVWLNGEGAHIKIDKDGGRDFTQSNNFNFEKDCGFCFFIVFRTGKDYSGGSGYLLNKGVSNQSHYRLYIDTGNRLVATLKNSDDSTVSIYSNSVMKINDRLTHSVLIRCDRGGSLEMYLNGVLQSDHKSCPSGTIDNKEPLYLGRGESDSNYFQGELCMVRMWDCLLSVEEAIQYSTNPVRALYYDIYGKECNQHFSVVNPYGKGSVSMQNDGWNYWGLSSWSITTVKSVGNYAMFTIDGGNTTTGGISRKVNDWLKLNQKYRLTFDWQYYVKQYATGGDEGLWACLLGNEQKSGNQIATISKNDVTTLVFEDMEQVGITVTHSGTRNVSPLGDAFTRVCVEFKVISNNDKYLIFKEWNTDTGGILMDRLSCRKLGCCLDLSGKSLNNSSTEWVDIGPDAIKGEFVNDPQPF